ncbi:acyl-CoA N-acyltransferase [Durotheca rogersii]|uniref:acyl-CoA N-acyltransferase n=1 Tax=Durotheca rogersii TaxID=419775 RepID=UPI002220773B|nr:acyl-CoA N-acyltransferase [Durotheca rogersii]KAI5863336.1 acyl-CoA N-acyltransferase [Durotheca rogersii]
MAAIPTPRSPPAPIVTTDKCFIRGFAARDVGPLAAAANHAEISMYMTNRFPHPYTAENARFWVDFAAGQSPAVNFAICTPDGAFAGSIGLTPGKDVEYRTWEVGYWVAREHWGKGIAASALAAFTAWAFHEFPDLLRIEAGVHGENAASARVLERAGYVREGVRRKAVYKRGQVRDYIMYGFVREEPREGSGEEEELPSTEKTA